MTLNVLAVSAEAFPLAKTGGLGDAVSGLSQSLGAQGARVTLMLPAYQGTEQACRFLRQVAVLSDMPGGDATLLAGECPELGLNVLLLKNDVLYDREGLYVRPDGNEHPDNGLRFAALAHAAVRVAQGIDAVPRPHIIHCHDWHAALVPVLLRQYCVQEVKTVLTLHNVAFQGWFPLSDAQALGLDDRYAQDPALQTPGCLNFLKAGVSYADLITVVSHNYAREILTPQFGCGLESALRGRISDLMSIPNGIDARMWDPARDQHLGAQTFSAGHLANKAACKRALQSDFGLTNDGAAPLMAMCSRMTTQKMADIAAVAIPLALQAHPELQVCVMGQGDKGLESALKAVARDYPGRCSVHIGFDEARAHLLHAGADMLLHGSRFEPFGLTPIYAMRYGALPIASRVGGMADTIVDPIHPQVGAARTGTGVLFEGEQAYDMLRAIERALRLYRQSDVWQAMRQNAMRVDFDWSRTAPMYMRAFQSLRPDVTLNRIPERVRMAPARGWQPVSSVEKGWAGAPRPTLKEGSGAGLV